MMRTCLKNSAPLYQKRCFGQPVGQTHPHLMAHDEVTPGITRRHYEERRNRLMDVIAQRNNLLDWQFKRHVVVIPSACIRYMSHDIPYVFRQHTDFLYLCGFQEPDSILVLEGDSKALPNHKSTLFVQKKDPHKELWEGSRAGTQGALDLTGVTDTYTVDKFPAYLTELKLQDTNCKLWYNFKNPYHALYHFQMSKYLEHLKGEKVEDPTNVVQELRVIKSEEEICLMQKSNDIASRSLEEVMKFSHPGVNEAHLWAKMDFECRIRGAEYLAYPPVVAGGDRCNTLHYIRNNQMINKGEMVLIDSGCEYHGYASDITRTFPVSGKFTEPQKELYYSLLAVQEACIEMCALHDRSLDDLLYEMHDLLATTMSSIGVIPSGLTKTDLMRFVRTLCPHHLGHYLGMDVHDVQNISVSKKLRPGMVLTIEPGVYIPASMTQVPSWFRGTGIRIEDNVLITENGYRNLTSCAKSVEDIEQIMAT